LAPDTPADYSDLFATGATPGLLKWKF